MTYIPPGITYSEIVALVASKDARIAELEADATRVCSHAGCTAAIIRRDDGTRVCAAGHLSRWVERSEFDASQAEVARLTQCLAMADRSEAYKRYQDEITILHAEVNNLASLVRILIHSLRKVNPNSSNIIRAMDYLKRSGLTGSILRSDEPQPDPSKTCPACDVCGGGGVCYNSDGSRPNCPACHPASPALAKAARTVLAGAHVIPESGGHLESEDCWCEPTVEEHDGGTLIIHNRTH